MSAREKRLLSIRGLTVDIDGPEGTVRALDQVDMAMEHGEVVGLVGESGGGKSMIARTLVRLLPSRARVAGDVQLDGRDVFSLSGDALRDHRGSGAALCFQTPRSSLSPARTVGQQLIDRLRAHGGHSAEAARGEAIALFERVGLGDAERRLDAFPHQLSGGMCQRVMIALALACHPALLLADEPTTGLDVTLTRGILKLIADQAKAGERGVLIISHDLASLAEVCDRIVVLETGKVVEEGATADILYRPSHPYTRKLVDAVPDIARRREATAGARGASNEAAPVLAVEHLDVVYQARFTGKGQQALFDVSFDLHEGETLGIVGESGSGKSTLSRTVMGLQRPSAGSVRFQGIDLAGLTRDRLRALRRRMQMVFQDPVDALNPRMTVEAILADPLRLTDLPAGERSGRIDAILTDVGLGPDFRRRRPHELSGGQAQRVGLARALVIDPALVVLDEPTSALDVTVQAQILELIRRLTARRDRAYVMVSHDLATVRSICDRVLVLSRGRVVEIGHTETLFTDPRADKTRELLAAAPRLATARGAPTSPFDTNQRAEQGTPHAI